MQLTRFIYSKTTKGTVMYSESPEAGKPELIGTLYVKKPAAKTEADPGKDYPEEIYVAISAQPIKTEES